VKSCYRCADQVQEAALRCRFCGANVAVDPLATGEAEEVDKGKRYVLASSAESYTIYALGEPGIPVKTFPRTDDGVEDALVEMQRLERAVRPRWLPVVLGLFIAAGAFYLISVTLSTFYNPPPSFGQEDHITPFSSRSSSISVAPPTTSCRSRLASRC